MFQDHEIKQKEKEKEETGLELYAVQEEVYRQQKVLEDCETTIESLMKERESLDESVKTKKSNWKEEVNQLNCAKKKGNARNPRRAVCNLFFGFSNQRNSLGLTPFALSETLNLYSLSP